MRHIIRILLIFTLLPFISCKKSEEIIDIELPETSVVSSSSSWGVIKFPYVRVRKSPCRNESISSAFRQGDIVKILKSSEYTTSSEGGDILWFYTVFDDIEGWVEGDYLRIFSSKEQATTASKMFN